MNSRAVQEVFKNCSSQAFLNISSTVQLLNCWTVQQLLNCSNTVELFTNCSRTFQVNFSSELFKWSVQELFKNCTRTVQVHCSSEFMNCSRRVQERFTLTVQKIYTRLHFDCSWTVPVNYSTTVHFTLNCSMTVHFTLNCSTNSSLELFLNS